MKFRKTPLNVFLLITLSSSLITLTRCSSPLTYDCIWADKPVTIDGKAKEWKIPLDFYDPKTKLNFSVANDRSNLYVCVRATETETQRGIIHTGLQIWIDTTGGKKKQLGIQFPIIQKTGVSSAESEAKKTTQDESQMVWRMKSQYSGSVKQMKLTGFRGIDNGLAELPNMYGINAALNWDTNHIVIYEACIPLKTFCANAYLTDSNKVIGVSLIVTVNHNYEGGGGHGGGGSGGNMGGGSMGGMHGGAGGSMQGGGGGHGGGGGSEAESISTSIKFRLALK